jgi:hypothetical protein
MKHRIARITTALLAVTALVAASVAGAVAAPKSPIPGKGPKGQGAPGLLKKVAKRGGVVKFKNGTTTVSITAALPAGLSVAPVAPGAQPDPAKADFTFPITKGMVVFKKRGKSVKPFAGYVRHSGGLKLSVAGKPDITLTNFRAVLAAGRGGAINAKVNGKGSLRVFTLSGLTRDSDSVDGKLLLARQGAKALNAAYGTTLAAGTELGTISVAPAK